jgi:hypothetical protein
LANDKKRNPKFMVIQELKNSRNDQVKVAGKRLPAFIAMSLEVRPLVIKVKRKTGKGMAGIRTAGDGFVTHDEKSGRKCFVYLIGENASANFADAFAWNSG